ncbi:conserved unknown protein [Ectocarpus siliculosus]|uniref:Uncharacterized protein n=1 Tax=Ectocarpus siliculosus TaxID=2880 RepID=D7FL27_ECTSI|nr:conserved unknown protein [Ectocarpus siliculosus]|eukprot:CBJ29564.1 conserved unknown protein [Ectocarpus siliculosus]
MMDGAAQSKGILPMEAKNAAKPGPCAPQGAPIEPTNSVGEVGATSGSSTAGGCAAADDVVGANAGQLTGGAEGTARVAANKDTTGVAGENGDGVGRDGKAVCFVKLNPGAENNSGHIGEEHSSSDCQKDAEGAAVDAALNTRPNTDGLGKSSGHVVDRSNEAQDAVAVKAGVSQLPVRSENMGSQVSKAAPAAGGTRKGQWTFKNQTKCRFCGGRLCLRCSEQCALRCKGAAVNGLHSHWISDSIIGMQRPSSRLIKTYDIVGQFKRKGVTAIFNLTEPGEHPHCGDGLEKASGFPYLPETFMREGISVYNFSWEDMTTPSMALLSDIIRVALSCLRTGGKIAVHCHAGYGRTGLVIASILVMMNNLPPQQAVALVREKRPTSLQTNAQVSMVGEFANFVRGVRVVYHFTDHARVTLGQHLAQQPAKGPRMWLKLLRAWTTAVKLTRRRIPAQLLYDWLAQLAVPPITVTELRRALPQSTVSVALEDDGQEATVKATSAFETSSEGQFHRLNLLPVGQVRLLQCLTDCVRNVRDSLAAAGTPQGRAYQKGCLRVAIAMVHLHSAHEGLLVGRNIAQDVFQAAASLSTPTSTSKHRQPLGAPHRLGSGSLAGDLMFCSKAMEVLVDCWRAPLRCRPYSKLEALDNQPEIHGGNEEYWHQKRRSVVPPKYRQQHHDAAPLGAEQRTPLRRRSASSGNVKQGLENVAPFDVIKPLEDEKDDPGVQSSATGAHDL